MARKRTRRPDLFIPSRGIRVPAGRAGGPAANLRAFTALDGTSAVTHQSTGRVWTVGLPSWMQEDWRIHVARERDGSKPHRHNVVGHRLTFLTGEVVVDRLRVTSPARTWLDLAAFLTPDELVAAGESIVVVHGPDFPAPALPRPASKIFGGWLLPIRGCGACGQPGWHCRTSGSGRIRRRKPGCA